MASSQLSSPKKTSAHSSSKLKQKRLLELKKKNKYITSKSPTRLVSKARKVKKVDNLCSSLLKEEAHNTLELVKCNEEKIDSTSHSRSFVDGNSLALKRAYEVQDNLDPYFPSCVKFMLRSHVTGGFWLSLPRSFCLHNLPKHDETVMLVGENDEEYNTKYLAHKNGLSGGWRGFSISHNLLEGDVVVFQLVEKWKFKVFIVRAGGPTEIDWAISLLNLNVEAKPTERESICEALMQKNVESPGSCSDQAYSQGNGPMMLLDHPELPSNQFGNNNHENSRPDMSVRLSKSAVDLNDLKSFEGFNIVVDGLAVDSEIHEHIRKKYYKLCCSQKCYLHEHLLAGLNFKLVAGIISETVNVADAIRSAKFITPFDNLETWDKTLKSFEKLGMAVAFLRERLKKLNNISNKQKKKLELQKRKLEAKTLERTTIEKEMRSLNLKLLNAERAMRRLNDEMEALKMVGKKGELTFKDAASAPW